MINPDRTHYIPAPDILFTEVDDEMVLFDPNRGLDDGVYVLDDIGARIWQLIVDDGYKAKIVEQLLLDYDVDDETVHIALGEFFTQLIQQGFLVIAPSEEEK